MQSAAEGSDSVLGGAGNPPAPDGSDGDTVIGVGGAHGSVLDSCWRRLRHGIGTLLGRPRRWRVLSHLPRNSVGAEIGVFKGEFTRDILRIVKPSRLHLVDAWWLLYGERYPDWGAYTDFGRLRTRDAFDAAKRVAEAHSDPSVCVFHVEDDLVCLARFPDLYFDWVYLDTSHTYDQTRSELEILARVVKPEGTILGDDWTEDPASEHYGAGEAIRDFCARSSWRLVATDSFGQWVLRCRTSQVSPHSASRLVSTGGSGA